MTRKVLCVLTLLLLASETGLAVVGSMVTPLPDDWIYVVYVTAQISALPLLLPYVIGRFFGATVLPVGAVVGYVYLIFGTLLMIAHGSSDLYFYYPPLVELPLQAVMGILGVWETIET